MSPAYALISVLHTGNVVVDAAIAALVVALASRLPELWGRALEAAREAWWGRRDGYQVTVYKHPDGDDATHNQLFWALRQWFSEALASSPGGSVEEWRGPGEGRDRSVEPARGALHVFDWKGACVRWHLDYATDPKEDRGQRLKQRYVLSCDDPLALDAFLDHAQALYRESMRVWKPSMYALKTYSSSQHWERKTLGVDKTFDAVFLPRDAKARLLADLDAFLAGRAWYERAGLDWRRGYLLHGVPGTGKTSIVRAISSRARFPICNLNLRVVSDDAALASAFDALPSPCVLVLEDVDCMGEVVHARPGVVETGTRTGTGAGADCDSESGDVPWSDVSDADADGSETPARRSVVKLRRGRRGVTLSALLNCLDGVGGDSGRITVLTTNRPEVLDPALVRPGRVDLRLELGRCTADMLDDMAARFYPDGPRATTSLPPGVFTPAQVSSAYLAHRESPDAAHAYLLSIARDV